MRAKKRSCAQEGFGQLTKYKSLWVIVLWGDKCGQERRRAGATGWNVGKLLHFRRNTFPKEKKGHRPSSPSLISTGSFTF